MTNELMNLTAAAGYCGVCYETFWKYCYTYNILPRPSHRKGMRRYYALNEMPELRAKVQELKNQGRFYK